MSNETKIIAPEGSPILTVERIFDAPREKVFKVFTEKDAVTKWWSPEGDADVKQLDFREGGMWKFSSRNNGSDDATFHGFFHEISAPKRFVQTSEYDNLEQMIGDRGHTVLARYEFSETEDGRTRLVTTEVYLSPEDRDNAIQSGMEPGIIATYNKIDALLAQG